MSKKISSSSSPQTKILVVEKSGEIKEVLFSGAHDNLAEISKRAGHKNPKGFEMVEQWNIPVNEQEFCIRLYGKVRGRANYENKYEFPPPVDTLLLFGSCVLIRHDAQTNEIISLTAKEWLSAYNYLYGGFEELEGDEEEDEEEDEQEDEEEEAAAEKTKSGGYKKDDFVVDDDDEDEDEEDYEDEEDLPKKTRKTAAVAKKSTIDYYNCDNELSEEKYIE